MSMTLVSQRYGSLGGGDGGGSGGDATFNGGNGTSNDAKSNGSKSSGCPYLDLPLFETKLKLVPNLASLLGHFSGYFTVPYRIRTSGSKSFSPCPRFFFPYLVSVVFLRLYPIHNLFS